MIRRYLPEIDTLRAVAVMLVVLFHAYPSLVPNGFLGVDIFFVISGYVISRAYLFPILERRASLADFYSARFRRLAPALFLTVGATTAASFVLLMPRELSNLARSLLAQPFYVQNIYYWNEGDYFAYPLQKPLLHTWSLAVEEQFYLLFGAMFLVAGGRRRLFWTLLIGAPCLSLLFYFAFDATGLSPRTAFYLLPGRLWQLGLGILAFCIVRKYREGPERSQPLLSLLAVGLICIVPLVPMGKVKIAPTAQTLAACGATAWALALIELNTGHLALLRLRAVRYIGKISYPLYLWHWPPLSIGSIVLDRPLNAFEATLAMLLAFVLASLTYHLVETPIRSRRVFADRRALFRAFCTVSIATLAVATTILLTNGATFRYPERIAVLFTAHQDGVSGRCPIIDQVLRPMASLCLVNAVKTGPGILVLGDSHADQYRDVLATMGDAYGVPVYYARKGRNHIGRFGPGEWSSLGELRTLLDEAKARGVTTIISLSSWGAYDRIATFERNTAQILAEGFRITFFERTPMSKTFDPSYRAKVALEDRTASTATFPQDAYRLRNSDLRKFFAGLAQRYPQSIAILSPEPLLCANGACAADTDGRPNYFDDNHVTQIAARRIAPLFKETFARVAANR
ncbi:MAG: acyltransferase [Reyranella sp.]|uniref:acyltransferase family protein n=1 Tax=Reyranella sp. TaxID=1929291 RepID=UPI00122857DD|nr:acyltransferase family protein [Reyranella sp.]TAJ85360.1 MAG: acyltransferase [Reyranella sp.]TBR27014.1 MAG: acyltransferase [Reyranella sp.]